MAWQIFCQLQWAICEGKPAIAVPYGTMACLCGRILTFRRVLHSTIDDTEHAIASYGGPPFTNWLWW